MATWNTRPAELGISYRQLDHWTRLGYLHPDQRRNISTGRTGTGYHRQWPEYELAVAAAMGRLTRMGLTLDAAHRVARAGRETAAKALLDC